MSQDSSSNSVLTYSDTGMEETIFVVVEREEETEETDKSPSVELRPTARLGTRVSAMENFVSKTKQFYK